MTNAENVTSGTNQKLNLKNTIKLLTQRKISSVGIGRTPSVLSEQDADLSTETTQKHREKNPVFTKKIAVSQIAVLNTGLKSLFYPIQMDGSKEGGETKWREKKEQERFEAK